MVAHVGVQNTINSVFNYGFSLVDDEEGIFYLTLTYSNLSLFKNFVLNVQGNINQTYWDEGKEDWEVIWSALQNECDVYGKCRAFGNCNPQNSPICSCLRGFEPKNKKEWNRGNWTSGCVRRTPLQCERVNNGSEEGKKDGVLKFNIVKESHIG
jgi:hypothetical protein